MHFFQSHSGFIALYVLLQFPDLGSYKYTFLDFCVTHIWELILKYSNQRPVLSILFTKYFMRPCFMFKGGRKIFSGGTRGGLTTIFSPGVSDVRLGHN